MSNYPDGVTHKDVLAQDFDPECYDCGEEILDFDEDANRGLEGDKPRCLRCAVMEWQVRAMRAESRHAALVREIKESREGQRA